MEELCLGLGRKLKFALSGRSSPRLQIFQKILQGVLIFAVLSTIIWVSVLTFKVDGIRNNAYMNPDVIGLKTELVNMKELIAELPELKNRINDLESHGPLYAADSCKRLRSYGITKSGFYYLNPSGQHGNRSPINDHFLIHAFCDFKKNLTIVYHSGSGNSLDLRKDSPLRTSSTNKTYKLTINSYGDHRMSGKSYSKLREHTFF